MEATLTREFVYTSPHLSPCSRILFQSYVLRCADLRLKIQTITDGEYAVAKRDVDQLRAELGQAPLPGLHETLEERKRESVIFFLTEPSRRMPTLLLSASCINRWPISIHRCQNPLRINALTLLSMGPLRLAQPPM